MIAAAAFCSQQPIATRNISDFDRFTPYGVKVISIPTLI
jgi:predicted nucleic acid-binding protein